MDRVWNLWWVNASDSKFFLLNSGFEERAAASIATVRKHVDREERGHIILTIYKKCQQITKMLDWGVSALKAVAKHLPLGV